MLDSIRPSARYIAISFICIAPKNRMPNKALQQNRGHAGYSLKLLWLRSAEGSR
jgi:hypothetical protein